MTLTHVVQLVKNEQAKTDPHFIELLGRVRMGIASTTGLSGSSDVDILNQRVLSTLLWNSPLEFASFSDAPVVFGERRLRDRWNDERAKEFATSTKQDFIYYYAQ